MRNVRQPPKESINSCVSIAKPTRCSTMLNLSNHSYQHTLSIELRRIFNVNFPCNLKTREIFVRFAKVSY
ncbi:hypothetical protein RB195_001105 [Necator americanus]|uniref:Uncharacterized protein n=1 Tax=Necator americanus TaxID=51031 RepID=A0ABR1DCN3_NECAM